MKLTDGVAPGGVDGQELVGQGAVVTEVGAGGAEQDPVVNPVVDPDADAQLLTFPHAQEGAVLNVHRQALRRARNLQAGKQQRSAAAVLNSYNRFV